MKIKNKQGPYTFNIVIEEGGATISQDIAESNGIGKPWTVNKEIVNDVEELLFEMSRFNNEDRDKFVLEMLRRRLYPHEIERLTEALTAGNLFVS